MESWRHTHIHTFTQHEHTYWSVAQCDAYACVLASQLVVSLAVTRSMRSVEALPAPPALCVEQPLPGPFLHVVRDPTRSTGTEMLEQVCALALPTLAHVLAASLKVAVQNGGKKRAPDTGTTFSVDAQKPIAAGSNSLFRYAATAASATSISRHLMRIGAAEPARSSRRAGCGEEADTEAGWVSSATAGWVSSATTAAAVSYGCSW